MAVYFKFKSSTVSESVLIDGLAISVANLKSLIVAKKNLAKGSDFDIVLSNAQTNEVYLDEKSFVPKNSSVLVRRIPRPIVPVKRLDVSVNYCAANDDDFGDDLYSLPKSTSKIASSLSENEDEKIKALVETSSLDWQQPSGDLVAGGKGYGNKGPGRNFPIQREHRQGFENKIPPAGYVCHRCGVAGHFIQHCHTNGDPAYDKKKVRPPTGIPRTMLDVDPEGTYFLPTGQVAVLKPNESAFDREVDFLPSSARKIVDIPLELRCPLCKEVLKDAVLTSKCCFRSYCDKCIRTEIIEKGKCACGASHVLADDLLPNKTLRDAIDRLLSEPSQRSSITSSDNAGNRAHAPDVESAPNVHSKPSSPALSLSFREVSSAVGEADNSHSKELAARGKGKEQRQAIASVKQSTKGDDDSVESRLTKEESVEEVMDAVGLKVKKKVKAKRVRQEDMVQPESGFGHGPNYNNSQVENFCIHCGSYEHPAWNCYQKNGPGPFLHPPTMQGSFGPGFGPEMMGMMHPVPYEAHGFPQYQFQFDGPRFSPYDHGMMPHGAPQQMQWHNFDPAVTDSGEFGARTPHLKRKSEREQRFGREETQGYDLQDHGDLRRQSGRQV